ncbi:molybdopterin synthase sulfur carrier subunit [Helicobacter enhydrae]|uniref:Molybdopterin synthase sulfur carrier subunit n=1 Tax=Helicobacter enhydrae TaxID=222136 RepID=A0A1B1U470_9HELI|nr:MoaD/ThiS family protein [Helicobacter enhydrae]ANV97560.1 molybdopterin synthase sulfur carrier subunit [Helicobacter enhydrae]
MANVKVEFLGPIGLDSREFQVLNLQELRNALNQIAELQEWLPLSAIAVNDEIKEDLDFVFQDGDKVLLLPPVCGG